MRPLLTKLSRWLTLGVIVAVACWIRTHALDHRPMHADEANQAVKLGELLEAGSYAFDPRDHHGPTLYYAAIPIARLRGETTLADLTETTLRRVPALFGTMSVVLLALLGSLAASLSGGRHPNSPPPAAPPSGLGWPAIAAAAFLAVSPPSVYYSRYFIQETLLVTFTLGALVCAAAWWRHGRLAWAIGTGICMGCMQATKASAPLFIAAAVLAVLAARPAPPRTRRLGRDALFAVAAAFVTAALLYSSFGTTWQGLRDAFGAYGHALTRFGSDAASTGHEKPWWYYLRLFGWYREGGFVWHQAVFSALAVAGFVIAWVRRDPFLRWTAVYAVAIAAAFSLFAYKTPWHAVHFVPGFALLAGAAVAAIARLRTGRPVGVAFALIAVATLFQQTQRSSFARPADQRNPYAYVHSTPDVLKYRAVAEAAIARHPEQPIRVISEEYWPLPWYLRGIPQVGYYAEPPEDCDGALVICSATQADAVRARLRGTYQSTFLGLRPGVIFVLFTREP